MISIGQKIYQNNGLAPGFDFVRVALALTIVFLHAENVATGANYFSSRVFWLIDFITLIMFFSLSGFLVSGSAQRLSLANFMINRGLRIFPALIIEIVFSAFILGPIFTDLPVKYYLSSSQTYHYLTNVFGLINYQLPGVFEHNPKSFVNSSLWTVPCELGCYAIMGALMFSTAINRRSLVLLITVMFLAMEFIAPILVPNQETAGYFGRILFSIFIDRGSKLYIAFLLGIVGYLYRDRIPYDRRLFLACVIFSAGFSSLRPAPWMSNQLLTLLLAPSSVYVTVFIGATSIPKLPVFHRGDYSYGIYLYGVPIQQAVRAALPWTNTSTLNLVFSLVPIVLFAAFSWHCLEKQVLKLRKRFSFVARVRGVEGPGESLVSAPPPSPDNSLSVNLKKIDKTASLT